MLAVLLIVSLDAGASTSQDAIAVAERLHEALVGAAALNADDLQAARIDALGPVVRDTHDFATMSRLSVRRFWRDWSDAERDRFVAAFSRLSVATYASRFAGVTADTFVIDGADLPAETRAEVRALIRRPDDEPVTLTYLMQLVDGDWRIVNVLADGVSELSLMASEYFAIIESEGFDALIAGIEAEAAALETGRD